MVIEDVVPERIVGHLDLGSLPETALGLILSHGEVR